MNRVRYLKLNFAFCSFFGDSNSVKTVTGSVRSKVTVQRKWEVMDSNGWSFELNSNRSKQTTVLTVQFHLLWLFFFKRYVRLVCLVRTVHFCISGPFTFAYRSVFKSPVPFNFVHVRPLWLETAHFRRGPCNLNRSEFYRSIQKSQFFRKGQWKYH